MPDLAAAQARAAAGRNLADRPSQRRAAREPDARAYVRAPSQIQLRAAEGDGAISFYGVASVTERAYPMWDAFGGYEEVIAAGAFDASLARADLDVPLVLAHDSLRRIARTTNGSLILTLTGEGLAVEAPNLDPSDADVAYIAPKLRAGLVDEMSFAFRINNGEWSPDWTTFRITEADIHRGDVAIVGYGANPYTHGELRAEPGKPRGLDPRRLLPLLDAAIAS